MRWFAVLVFLGVALGQDVAPPNGPRRVDPAWHALVGATVHVAPGHVIEKGTVVFRDGRFVSVGQEAPPAGARVWDVSGRHVYPGFLDLWVEVDAPPFQGTHWNPRITPGRRVRELDEKTGKELRELGFTAALIVPRGGILRGQAALVSTAPRDPDPSEPPPAVYDEEAGQAVGFDRTRDGFPTSEMGAIAAIRQALIDGVVPPDPLFFDTADELQCLRASKIAREFDRAAVLVGSGTEFRRLGAIAADGFPVVVPLRFPRAPDVSSPGAQEAADLRDLMTWEQAPTNPRRLDAAGVTVALTSAKLDQRKRFWKQLREAVRHGLDPERALAMLTTNAAKMSDAQAELGTIETGKWANLVVAEGPLFATEARILEVWIDGKRHEIETGPDLAGAWEVETLPPGPPTTLLIDRRSRVTVRSGDTEARAQRARVVDRRLSFSWDAPSGMAMFTATVAGNAMRGTGMRADGARFTWTAKRTGPPPPSRDREPPPPDVPGTFGLPFGPYAVETPPPQPDLLIVEGATIWTCGPAGVIENGQMIVRKGKVDYVGPPRPIDAEGAVLVDAGGKHVTPGIVDCHSHTGISGGVNDSGQAVTAEVRIGDVTDPDDISWYRQLAGGVTAANSLHGSANPIGGQNQVVKLRWGAVHPDDMHFEGAPRGIKFALGENVKQSNWGDDRTTRYPQTRMGVETLIRDRFLAAREYTGKPRDLELEALAEILRGERLIHCHSYRQDEILMLARIAKEFGFRIGTFQHILEGYKVAEAIRESAIGASAFSDWWAYKVEVQDAIPFNGALMHAVGVNVSFNSDSNDLARRLNVEAAKAVKYGGVPPAEALKFVTLNPAIQLGVADRVGSLEKGKDADFVVWSGDPLSAYSRCERTFLDGRQVWSVESDAAHRERVANERKRLVRKVLAQPKEEREEERDAAPAGEGGGAGAAYRRWWLDRLRHGGDPEAQRCGECGCLFFEEAR